MINLKSIYGFSSFIDSTDRLMNIDLNFSVDTRVLNEEHIFIAIVGEKFNPLLHLEEIVKSGCRFVVYEAQDESEALAQKYNSDLVFIKVENIELFIQQAGKAVANMFRSRGGQLIAISGSNGKTTTKEMLYHILESSQGEDKVICTQKNNNNHLGVPFTLFQIIESTKYAIVELGSNHPGEIENLCKIIHPHFSVTTNIGDTHLEFFNNRKNVFIEESVVSKYSSTCFFKNNDDDFLKGIDVENTTKSYGLKNSDYNFNYSKASVSINGTKVNNLFITGEHNFCNLAVAIVMACEITEKKIEEFILIAEEFKPTKNRSEWLSIRNQKIFLDAYNANPSSMISAIKGFADYLDSIGAKTSEACLVIGDMNELGENANLFHNDIGKQLNQFDFGNIIFVGNFSKEYQRNLEASSLAYDTASDVKSDYERHVAQYKFLFIKGSRSLQLETILDIS